MNALLTRQKLWGFPLLLMAITWLMYAFTLTQAHGIIEADGSILGRDYFAFFMAGDMLNHGQGVDALYDVQAQQTYQDAFMASRNPDWRGVCLYLNPPHYAWLMSLITPLGYLGSLLVFLGLSAAAFVVTVRVWRAILKDRFDVLLVSLTVAGPAFFTAFIGGQNTFFTLLILSGFAYCLLNRRPLTAGLMLALLAYKFQFILLPAAWLVYRRDWRAISGLALGAVATLGLTVLTTGFASVETYLHFGASLGNLMQQEGFDVHKQHSWHGFFALLGHGWMHIETLRWLAVLAGLATLLPCLRLRSILQRSAATTPATTPPGDETMPGETGGATIRGDALTLELAALFVATLLTSPHLFHYDLLLLALPAVLTYDAALRRGRDANLHLLLLYGTSWLAIGGAIASLTHVQLSPLAMLAWLLHLQRLAARPLPATTGGHALEESAPSLRSPSGASPPAAHPSTAH